MIFHCANVRSLLYAFRGTFDPAMNRSQVVRITHYRTRSFAVWSLNAIRYLAKTGIAWADLPTCFGKSNSLWHRYDRWCRNGVWEKIAAELRDDDTEWLGIDSSCIRASVAAAGAKKKATAPAVKTPKRWAGVAVGTAARSMRP